MKRAKRLATGLIPMLAKAIPIFRISLPEPSSEGDKFSGRVKRSVVGFILDCLGKRAKTCITPYTSFALILTTSPSTIIIIAIINSDFITATIFNVSSVTRFRLTGITKSNVLSAPLQQNG